MIFTPRVIQEIKAGRKTQSRQPNPGGRPKFKPGKDYAVQPGRGKPATARVVVVDIWTETLGDLTFEDARREGFKTRDDFFTAWTERYGRLDPLESVLVVSFQLDRRHHPRLMHKHSERGYTEDPRDALAEEPEAVDEATLNLYARENRDRFAGRRRESDDERMRRQELERELYEVLPLARSRGIDIRSEERVIRARLDAIRRKVHEQTDRRAA